MNKFFRFALIAVILLGLSPRETAHAFPEGCGTHPANLIRNGSMAPGHDTAFGFVSNEWEPFVFSGTPPRFEWVDNEKWDANGSQYFWSDGTPFDAGISQTVGGLQTGVFYRFRIGYSHARLDPGTATNDVHPAMGRQVGVDPLGGTDAHSPNVIWGPALFNSGAGMNPPDLTMTFAARADRATIYFRGIFKGAAGRAKVWFDVACMEPLSDLPAATPPPATAIPAPTARPNSTPTRVPATRVAQIAVTRTLTPAPAKSATPTRVPSATLTPASLRARPQGAEPSGFVFEMDAGWLALSGIASIVGAFFFFGLGFITWRRV